MATLISPENLTELLDGDTAFVLIDIRSADEVAEGIIPGAIWMDMSSRSFMEEVTVLPKEIAYCLYCASGGRSAMGSSFFETQGFPEIYELEGGVMSWLDKGNPLGTLTQ